MDTVYCEECGIDMNDNTQKCPQETCPLFKVMGCEGELTEDHDNKYDVLVIDPPWPKRKGGKRIVRPNQTRSLDYETMSVAAIFKLIDSKILPHAANTHTLFLWEIDQFLIEAEQNMIARGYKRHARLIWDKKNGVAPAFSIRYSHEYVVWWYKPRFTQVAKAYQGKKTTVFQGPPREHSRKPDEFYSMVNRWFPEATKVDIFSREYREGWDQWGDEKDLFLSSTKYGRN
jgi:N6-adenosine-specific RNA methylase IME4